MINWIDNADYDDLLSKNRFAPSGSKFFQGKVGDYFLAKMKEVRAKIGDAEHSATSKRIGWGP